jgi:hypothetical protein
MAPLRHLSAKLVVVEDHQEQEPSMGDITTIEIDLAKHVFQLHGVDEAGNVICRMSRARAAAKLDRRPSPPGYNGQSVDWSTRPTETSIPAN